jgi:hypothetical protein
VPLNGVAGAVLAVATSELHGCIVLLDGRVQCWGENISGQLGNGTSSGIFATPVFVSNLAAAQTVTVGFRHSCAIFDAGKVACWGDHSKKQLGNAALAGSESNLPVEVDGITTAVSIAAGKYHTCVLLSNKTIKCWGSNSAGQLGTGTPLFVDTTTPTTIAGITEATTITSGSEHSCTVLPNKTIQCWGSNYKGELATTSVGASATPLLIPGISNAKAVEGGGSFTCALLLDDTIKCWGQGNSGQMGNGAFQDSTTPVFVDLSTSGLGGNSVTTIQVIDPTSGISGSTTLRVTQ